MGVGFFTQGIKFTLPHPQISQRTILLICKVIKRAWQLLEEKPPFGFFLQSEYEDTITQLLVEIIENRLRKSGEVDGFNCALFGKVIREPKITNFDKKHPDKMPDIFFDLKREQPPVLSEQDGLFVECKPVDRNHPILSCYCKKGLIRFVNGDYAWAMQDALMVGYVKTPYSFKKLASVLDDNKENDNLKIIEHYEVVEYSIYRSSHKREFEWPEKRGQACPVTISHLWLSRPE
ncbi:MAG: hypothetical protein HF978_14915 [Desulfobacteraceae bacterium]|nr:hypothetical protein [Desulfobacteraceae bacterium]MBC2756831.1 hypothetical protein [Desulfobacteraceae bacterium]